MVTQHNLNLQVMSHHSAIPMLWLTISCSYYYMYKWWEFLIQSRTQEGWDVSKGVGGFLSLVATVGTKLYWTPWKIAGESLSSVSTTSKWHWGLKIDLFYFQNFRLNMMKSFDLVLLLFFFLFLGSLTSTAHTSQSGPGYHPFPASSLAAAQWSPLQLFGR